MTYQITVSPIRGQEEIKNVEGVRELHTTLAQYRDLGYEIKSISRPRKMLNLVRKLQLV